MNAVYFRSNEKRPSSPIVALLIAILLLSVLAGCTPSGNNASSPALTHNLSEPLNGAASAKFDISTETGNLTIDRLTSGEPVLASGSLQYFEDQGLPTRSVTMNNGQAALTIRASQARQTGFHLPWEACNGGTEWQIHLNPSLPSDITAHSGGGNVRLDLSGTVITRLMADTGGGNMDVILTDETADLNVTAKTGAGNVTVEIGSSTGRGTINASSGAGNVEIRLPGSIAARIHLTSGMGQAMLDSRFNKIDDKTYQSSDYDSAADRLEITASSGAGNVSISTK